MKLLLVVIIPKSWIELHEAVNSGNVEKTKNILEKLENQDSLKHESDQDNVGKSGTSCTSNENNSEMECSEEITNKEEVRDCVEDILLNQSFESYNETVLHLASRLGHADIVNILLEAGGNPAVK